MARIRFRSVVSCGVGLLALGMAVYAQKSAYDEPFRPQVHFSPRVNWTNDPNGLVYFEGEYHLFFQYNPFGDQWGHMSWGHAVSSDLLHWHELPVAIAEADGKMIYTGSVVVDRENTSGFCAPKTECLVAVYTANSNPSGGQLETQDIAYSLDKGRTWTKYEKNPVLDLQMADFRDPSVFWDAESRRWIMSVSMPKEHKVRFYGSPNLKEWTLLGDFGPAGDVAGDWECPDLLKIPSANGKESIWALKVGLNPGAPQGGSGEQYFLGNFDGKGFVASNEAGSHGWTNYGKDDYCAISFNGLSKTQRPVLLGWMSNWQYASKLPTSPWRGQMSMPRRLTFFKDSAGFALKQEPVLTGLRKKNIRLGMISADLKLPPIDAPYELDLDFGHPLESVFGVKLYSDAEHWTEVGFDTKRNEFYIDRTHSGEAIAAEFPMRTVAPLARDRANNVKILVDRSSLEAYAQDDSIAMTDLIFPSSTKNSVQVFSDSGSVRQVSAQLWELAAVWTADAVSKSTTMK